jgi:hypothetical protein
VKRKRQDERERGQRARGKANSVHGTGTPVSQAPRG